jgi:hypothetical protein
MLSDLRWVGGGGSAAMGARTRRSNPALVRARLPRNVAVAALGIAQAIIETDAGSRVTTVTVSVAGRSVTRLGVRGDVADGVSNKCQSWAECLPLRQPKRSTRRGGLQS